MQPQTAQCRTDSAQQTRQLAAALEPLLRAGDVVLLSGDLGAGKTVFVQGLAEALGVSEQVTSPTFTLAASYQGRLRLHHLDVYRLDNLAEVLDLDLPELLDDDALVCIEWGEVLVDELPREFLRVQISLTEQHTKDAVAANDSRNLEIEAVGSSWQPRVAALRQALASFASTATGN